MMEVIDCCYLIRGRLDLIENSLAEYKISNILYPYNFVNVINKSFHTHDNLYLSILFYFGLPGYYFIIQIWKKNLNEHNQFFTSIFICYGLFADIILVFI